MMRTCVTAQARHALQQLWLHALIANCVISAVTHQALALCITLLLQLCILWGHLLQLQHWGKVTSKHGPKWREVVRHTCPPQLATCLQPHLQSWELQACFLGQVLPQLMPGLPSMHCDVERLTITTLHRLPMVCPPEGGCIQQASLTLNQAALGMQKTRVPRCSSPAACSSPAVHGQVRAQAFRSRHRPCIRPQVNGCTRCMGWPQAPLQWQPTRCTLDLAKAM